MDFVGPLGCPSEFIHEDVEELKKKEIYLCGRRCRRRTGISAGEVDA